MITKNYKLETAEETENFDDANFNEQTRLAELFKKLDITNYSFSPRSGENAFNGFDATFSTGGREYIVEAKVRAYKLDSFANHPLLEHKADGLHEHWLAGKKILYIQFFTDGAIIYNLSERFLNRAIGLDEHQLNAVTKLMDNNTAKDRGKSYKQVFDLSPSDMLKDKIMKYRVNHFFYLNNRILS
jgi:hypothetical protein